MKIKDLSAYKRIKEKFENGEFKLGTVSKLKVCSYRNGMNPEDLTPGHFVEAIQYSKIDFENVPKSYLTRDFFIMCLSGADMEIVDYVKNHMGEEFDREFFKDHIASKRYALEFEQNCFEYMPLEYIDEEMVSCAMIHAIEFRSIERRGDLDDWFYSIARRKPEVLTQDLWTLGARLFAERINGKNEFLNITPEQYKTKEYYFAMCLENDTPVMEDFPENILDDSFLIALINDNVKNIRSFSEEALDRKAPMEGEDEEIEFWKAAILNHGYVAGKIPVNDERVEFFFEHYDKESNEYRYGFKEAYKKFLKTKNGKSDKVKNDDVEKAAIMTLCGALAGMELDNVVDMANASLQDGINRTALLPIGYLGGVPYEFCKVYDKEEYLCEVYKKLGIEIVGEHDSYYYDIVLPPNLYIEKLNYDYCLKNEHNNILLTYKDIGPFYDRTVYVDKIYCSI